MSAPVANISIKSVVLQSLQNVRANAKTLIIFALMFHGLSVFALAPVRGALLRALVETTGHSAVSNFEIAQFVLSVPGFLWLILGASSGLVLLLIQQSGFLHIARVAREGRALPLFDNLLGILRSLPRLLSVALLQALAVLGLIAIAGAALAALYWFLLAGKDINYYLVAWPPRFIIAVGLASVCAAILAIAVSTLIIRWSLALPICLLEGASWSAPLAESWMATRGLSRPIGLLLLTWIAAVASASVLIIWGLVASAELILALVPQSTGSIIATTSGLLVVMDGIAGAIGLVGTAGYVFLVERLYTELGGDKVSMPLPGAGRIRDGLLQRISGRRTIAVGAVIFAALSIGTSYALVETADLLDTVEITAHRGSSSRAPENTLAAVRAAMEDGADYAEIDVQETSDGVLVLLHDTDLKRIAGIDRKIWQTPYNEIRDLDAGSWFAPQFASERVPTLQQVIDLARGRIKLNIELKFNGHDQALATRVVDLIKTNRFEADAVVTSLNHRALEKVATLDASLKTGLIVSAHIGDLTRTGVDFLSLSQKLATAETVSRVQARSLGVHVWTVNKEAGMHAMIDLGVDNIITDHPAKLRSVLKERAELSDVERLLLTISLKLRSRN